MKIYKYSSFTEHSLKILIDGTLKFSSPLDFNDPFDCIADYDIEKSITTYMNRKDILEELAKRKGITLKKLVSNRKKLKGEISRVIKSGFLHDGVMKKTGITCFSLVPDNILMWSHYANNHKGFIVEFESKFDNKDIIKNPEFYLGGNNVEYSNDMPKRTLGIDDFMDIYRQFLVKSKDWEYEKEYRVLSTNLGPGIHSFDQSLICSVVGGTKISQDDYERLNKEVDLLSKRLGKRIPISKAKMVQGKYKLDVKVSV